ncbi:MAG: ABC transporter ATP-binding protein [Elusimicrobiota bacterium]|jgi:iron complex transport system ATP-binding protein|nr:ABC transporter ATP-binding protein [Elusimicrobiota bacterium]
MIKVKKLSAGYGSKTILSEVDISINKGSFTAIIGRNGAGKSTFLKVLCGLIKQFKGAIFINGKDKSEISKNDFAKILAFMPQTVDMSFPFTVKEFLIFGRYPYMNVFKIASQKDYAVVENVLDFMDLQSFSSKRIDELSGGEKQKVLIAQTIVQETDILVFDEPTAHLDIGNQYSILEILKNINEKLSKTIIVTLHDLNAAGEFCQDIVLLDCGRVKNFGTAQDVLNYKDIESTYKTTVVVKTNPISGKPYIIPVRAKNCLGEQT